MKHVTWCIMYTTTMDMQKMSTEAIDVLRNFPHKENVDEVYEYDSELYNDYCGPHVIRLFFVLYREDNVKKIRWYHRNILPSWPYKISTTLDYDSFVKTYEDTDFYKRFMASKTE